MDPRVMAALSTAIEGRFDVLGELGEDERGSAFLAREQATGVLVALRLVDPGDASTPPSVSVQRVLDPALPGRAGRCPFCRTPAASWARHCAGCGGDLAGGPAPATPAELERLAGGLPGHVEVLGEIARAEGGAPVWFGRERGTGELLALSPLPRLRPNPGEGAVELELTPLVTRPPVPAVGSEPTAGMPTPAPTPTPAPPAGPPWVREGGGGGTGAGAELPRDVMVCPVCFREYDRDARFCSVDGQTLQPKEQRSDLVGRMLAGRYKILGEIGQGGMAVVYLAEHVRMGRICAVKILKPALAQNPESVARFSREAREAGRLDHPNIVAIQDFGESEGFVFLAMEYVRGTTLAALLKEANGPLPVGRAAALAAQVADALAAAHEKGLVHRDLKPENVLLTTARDGSDLVKVADFGIAKALNAEAAETLTRTGFVVGTPRYMSPEQLIVDKVDGRSDLYALGCVLYEMVTGQPLWHSGWEDYSRRLQQAAPRARDLRPDLPQELDDVIARTLERKPRDRYQTAQEIRQALEPFREPGPALTPTPTPAPVVPPPPPQAPRQAAPRRRAGKLVWTGVAAVVVIGAVAAVVTLRTGGGAGSATEPPTTRSTALAPAAAEEPPAVSPAATSTVDALLPTPAEPAPRPAPAAEPARGGTRPTTATPAAAAPEAPRTKAAPPAPRSANAVFADSAAAFVARFAAAVSSARLPEVRRVLGLAAEGQEQEWRTLFEENQSVKAVWRPVSADTVSVPASFTFMLSLTYDRGRELRVYRAGLLPVGGTWKPVSIRRVQ